MATIDTLKTYYGNVMRTGSAQPVAAHQTLLTNLSAQVDAGTLSLAAAQTSVSRLAIDTTSVATIAYNFFTGATPTQAGLDYLVAPTGPNPNNLNSAYYQSFNIENRYINFAVNLGKLGEGQQKFAAAYGALTLPTALSNAYSEIFGVTPDAAKVFAILNEQVPNGLGGTYARSSYFAFYGGDSVAGIGTKAAMIGWLMAEAEKADTGTYAKANSAFLADLGPDGVASFNTELVGRYGGAAGATIAFGPEQSVSLTAADPLLKSTADNDTLTGTSLSAGRSLATGDGNDTITASGTINGSIDTGAGNDTVTVGSVGPSNGANGQVRLGAGNDLLTVTGLLADGAGIDGGPGDDTLVAGFPWASSGVQVVNVEHLVVTAVDPANPFVPILGGPFSDITVRGTTGRVNVINIPNSTGLLRVQDVSSGEINLNYAGRYYSNPTYGDGRPRLLFEYPEHSDLTLNNVRAAVGATLTVSATAVTIDVHVENDTVLTGLGGGKLVVSGPGTLTAGIYGAEFDGSQAARLNLTANMAVYQQRTIVLSAHDDRIAFDASPPLNNSGLLNVTLGAGADTLSIYQTGAAYRFANLHLTGGVVDAYARVTDFVKGTDHVDLGATATAPANLTQFVGAAASLDQALANVAPRLAADSTGVFEYGGDTFLYRQDATAGVNTGDGLIRLVGVTGLSTGTGAGSVDIHYG